VTVNTGTVTLGSAGRFASSPSLTISGGQLTIAGNETVGAYTQSAGNLTGAFTMTGSSYALQGGTVNSNLGAGTTTVTSGTTTLNGTSSSLALNVNSGTLSLGSASRLIGVSPVLTVAASATVNMAGSEVLGSMGGAGTVNLAAGSVTLGASSGSSSFSGIIAGAGGLIKSGASTQTLSAANTYAGETIIKEGTLALSGSGKIASAKVTVGDAGSSGAVLDALALANGLTIAANQTLGGVGTIKGTTTIQGVLAPGNSTGILNNIGNVSFEAGSSFNMELGGTTAGTNYDQLNVTGSVSLAGLLSVSMGTYVPTNGDMFFIIANDSADAIAGVFSNAATDGSTYTFGSQQFKISYFGNYEAPTKSFTGGNDVVLLVVPEPTVALLGAVSALCLLRRRRVA
jgi:autotransporter-associated beta strand protein